MSKDTIQKDDEKKDEVRAPARGGITLESFLANYPHIRKKYGKYLSDYFKSWVRNKKKDLLGKTLSPEEWEKVYEEYAKS